MRLVPAQVEDVCLRAAAERIALDGFAGNGKREADVRTGLEQLVRCIEAGDAKLEEFSPEHGSLHCRLLDRLRGEAVREWACEPGLDAGYLLSRLQVFEDLRALLADGEAAEATAPLPENPNPLEAVVEFAHDLRSPLTSILSLSDRLHQLSTPESIERRQLGIIYSAGLGLLSVVSDAIELARSNNDRACDGPPVPFSISDVFQGVVDVVQPMAEEKGLEVRHGVPVGDQRIGCPAVLNRILLNLTTNGLKFTDEGYVELSCKNTGPERVEFSVRDTGRGINPDFLKDPELLFRAFRREAGREGFNLSGTGLGLSVCRKLARALDSELQFETRAGWGTRFFFEVRLPAIAPF